ncbi:MAG: hypothetical protein JSS60_01345 [Verrucomicrobia bacterium]|nr:hypothetical protein [Verrucomicrobiota bacterium]
MVKKVGQGTSAASTSEAQQVSKPPAKLQELKTTTANFMMNKGASLMGAGKPAVVSKTPPSRDTNRVSHVISGSILSPSKKQRT